VPLLEQYRSDAPLVDIVNSMFMRLFPLEIAHDPNVFRPAYRELHAARPTLRRELDSRVTMLLAEHEEKNERHRAEARVAADWILANRDGSALDLQRFAVLFRRLTKLDDYLDVFDQCGIDYVLPPTRLFLEKRAPVDLVAVLRAIAWPFDTGAQISAARTPYFALTDVEIAQGKLELERHQDGAEATGPSPAGTPWHEFTSRIAAFREESFARSISSLIDLILQTTDIEAVYGATTDGTRHLRHLEHLRSIAFEYEQRQRGSLRQFVDEIARRRDDPEEAEPSLVDESKNAVRILSVHAAKGLEFDTVILPDLAFPTTSSEAMQLFTVESPRSLVLCGRADSISANFRHTEDDEKLKKISSRREEAEMRRLFYVAVTRAKTDVVFVCSLGDDTRNTGFMKCLYEALGEDRNSLRALWPDDGRQIRATAVGPVAFERPVRDAPATAAQQRARLRDRDLETQLRGGDIVPAALPPIESDLETLTQAEIAARRAGSRNRATGTLLHRVLELWDGRSDLEPLLARLAAEDGVETEGVARVRRRLATVARSPVALRILQGETLGREVPVRFVESGNLVERRIDRLLRETENDLVVDYKSGKAETSRIAKDRLQVERYCEAVRNITGRPCRGALWYIDLDADELIEVG
jgi:ATP-dependent helicase/nuclease subunit A